MSTDGFGCSDRVRKLYLALQTICRDSILGSDNKTQYPEYTHRRKSQLQTDVVSLLFQICSGSNREAYRHRNCPGGGDEEGATNLMCYGNSNEWIQEKPVRELKCVRDDEVAAACSRS